MLKRDLMKEIENSLKIVREKIDEGIAKGDTNEAFNAINKQLKGLVGLDITTIDTISFDSVKDIVNKGFENNAEKYVALGMLMKFEGNVYDNSGEKGKALYYYKKGIKAFNEANNVDYGDESIAKFSDIQAEIAPKTEEQGCIENYKEEILELADEVNKYKLSSEESKDLFRSYEIVNRFDKAEDILFKLIKEEEHREDIVDIGLSFYKRLQSKSDDDLINGNLPREEVEESFKEVQKLI